MDFKRSVRSIDHNVIQVTSCEGLQRAFARLVVLEDCDEAAYIELGEHKRSTDPLNDLRADGYDVYAMAGHVYGTDQRQLLDIGKVDDAFLTDSWRRPAQSGNGSNAEWILGELKHPLGMFSFVVVENRQLIADLETLLIYVHQPNQNSKGLNLKRLHLRNLFGGERTIVTNVLDGGATPPYGLLPTVVSHEDYWGYYWD